MNENIKAGEKFRLGDILPYEDGQIVTTEVVSNDLMKVNLRAFDRGQVLEPHVAPGEVLVFALDGEAIVNYEGGDHPLKAGEQFYFKKGAMHGITAVTKFKMAVVVDLSAQEESKPVEAASEAPAASRAFVDPEICVGCGLCASTCPSIFEMNGQGVAQVVADTTPDNQADILDAISNCPVGAIRE